MQKQNPTTDFPWDSRKNSSTTFNDFVCSDCFSCASNKSDMENMSNKMEKLVDKVDLLQQQMIQQNLLFQKHLIDGKEKHNESLIRKVEDRIEKILEEHNKKYLNGQIERLQDKIQKQQADNNNNGVLNEKIAKQNEEWNEKFCALQRSVQECKMENAEKVEKTIGKFQQQQMVEQNLLFQQNLMQQNEQSQLKFEANKGTSRAIEKVEQANNNTSDLEKKFGDLFNNLSIRSFKTNFVKIANKWDRTDGNCCGDKCILSNLDGNCKNGNGIVKLSGGGKVDYLEGNESNQDIKVFAKNAFKKSVGFSTSSFNVGKTLSIFYFEVTIIRNENSFLFGLKTNKCEYYVNVRGGYWNGSNYVEKFFPRNLKDGDVVGCGLILSSTLISEKKQPFIFFTLNGEKFDDYRVLEKGNNNDEFVPFVYLGKCSVDANFGEKEFEYKIEF